MGRKTVAVGDLVKVWTIVSDYKDFDQLKKDFAASFQRDWHAVMAGAGEPFSFHRDWRVYLAVGALREHEVVLAELNRRLRREGRRIYNTIFG